MSQYPLGNVAWRCKWLMFLSRLRFFAAQLFLQL